MLDLSVEQLEASCDELDLDVIHTPGIDRFCSSSAWVLPASRALMPPRDSWIRRGDAGWMTAMLGRHPSGIRYVEPLELAWGMACPLIGRDPDALAAEAAEELATRGGWEVTLIAGLPPRGRLLAALLRALPSRIDRRWGQTTIRLVASLEGGVDAFLARRTRNFRKALRAAQRDADAAGITFERAHATTRAEADAVYARILAIEARSWKGEEGVGIDRGPMRQFYAEMGPRLAERGRHRTLFARQGDRDLAYCLGAVFDGEYRGLQFSFERGAERYSLGSLLQYHQIVELVGEGVRRYDLGQDMEYKRRWAEEEFETSLLILVNR